MNDAPLMRVMNGSGNLLHQFDRLTRWQRASGQSFAKTSPRHEAHRVVATARVLANFVNWHNPRVIEIRRGLGFGAKPLDFLRRGQLPRQNHLQRDAAIQADLPRLVDSSHPASADLFQQFVISQRSQRPGVRGLRSTRRAVTVGRLARWTVHGPVGEGSHVAIQAWRLGRLPVGEQGTRPRGSRRRHWRWLVARHSARRSRGVALNAPHEFRGLAGKTLGELVDVHRLCELLACPIFRLDQVHRDGVRVSQLRKSVQVDLQCQPMAQLPLTLEIDGHQLDHRQIPQGLPIGQAGSKPLGQGIFSPLGLEGEARRLERFPVAFRQFRERGMKHGA